MFQMVLLFPFNVCLLAVPYGVALFTFSLTQCVTRQKPRSLSVICQDFEKAGSQPWLMVLRTSSTVFKKIQRVGVTWLPIYVALVFGCFTC